MTRQYLIGTHSHLLYAVLDEQWRLRDLRSLAAGHHYGIALTPDGRTALTKHRDDHLVMRDRDDDLRSRGRVPLQGDLGQVHQVAWVHDGLVLANTVGNSVIYQSSDGSVRHAYVIDDVDRDVNHVNSVFPMGGDVLALLNNRGARESEVLVLNLGRDRGWRLVHRFSLWHRACHNVHLDDEQMAYNASSSGRFVVVDVRRQRVATEHGFDGHTKGLSVTVGHFVIGVSDHAERADRYQATSRLVVMDRRSHDVVAEVPLRIDGAAVGNINEVRCLSETELAHAAETPPSAPWHELGFASSDLAFRVREGARQLARRVVRGRAT